MKLKKYSSNIAFIDLLFILLIGITTLYILSFLMINPITKTNEIKLKAEVLIIVEWEDSIDVDSWILGPVSETPISFMNRENEYIHLDRDDLGSDAIVVNGKEFVEELNREILVIRKKINGEYKINLHLYSNRRIPDKSQYKVNVQIYQIDPFKNLYSNTHVLLERGDVAIIPSIVINENDITMKNSDNIIVTKSKSLVP